jgi:transcriptional regulator with XRE-family HTH domain
MTTLEKIRNLRNQKGYSQDNMAHSLGMSQNNYCKLEMGKNKLTLEQLERIAAVFEVNPIELLDHKDEKSLRNEVERLQQDMTSIKTELSLFKKLWNHVFSGGVADDAPGQV